MSAKSFCRFSGLLFVFLLLTSAATAQDGWDRMSSLRQGNKLIIKQTSGRTVKGSFATATADTLAIESGGRRIEIARADVDRVYLSRRSSRAKRGLIGALAGAGAGVLIGVVAVTAGKADPLVPAGGFLIGIPAGAAVGIATGGSKKGELIYRR